MLEWGGAWALRLPDPELLYVTSNGTCLWTPANSSASALPRLSSALLPKTQYLSEAAYSLPGHKPLSFRDLVFLLDADAGGEDLPLRTEESLRGEKGQAWIEHPHPLLHLYALLSFAPSVCLHPCLRYRN